MPTNDNDATFGMGQGEGSGGDRSWSAPVHAADSNGNPVTVSFGQGNQEGQYWQKRRSWILAVVVAMTVHF